MCNKTKSHFPPYLSALVFINNHDNQRGHGGGGHVVSFAEPWELKLLTAFMMAHDYGEPRVMSSYYFNDPDEGPPGSQPNAYPQECGNGWVCFLIYCNASKKLWLGQLKMIEKFSDYTFIINWISKT